MPNYRERAHSSKSFKDSVRVTSKRTKQLRIIAVSLAVMLLLTVYLAFSGGLPRSVRNAVRDEPHAIGVAASMVQSIRTGVEKSIQDDAALFQAAEIQPVMDAHWRKAAAMLAQAKTAHDHAAALAINDRSEDEDQVQGLVRDVNIANDRALAEASDAQNDVRQWRLFQTDPARGLDGFNSEVRTIRDGIGPLLAKVEQAGQDWPHKQADLQTRASTLRTTVATLNDQWIELQKRAPTVAPAGHLAFVADIRTSLNQVIAAQTALDGLKTRIDELYVAYEDLLQSQEKADSQQQVREVVHRVTARTGPPITHAPEFDQIDQAVTVPADRAPNPSRYRGFAIEEKELGLYHEEASHFLQPPGYTFLTAEGAGVTKLSNRYGSWSSNDDTALWHWALLYQPMQQLFDESPAQKRLPTLGELRTFLKQRDTR